MSLKTSLSCFLLFASITACSDHCSVFSSLFGEPQCRKLNLSSQLIPHFTTADCSQAAHSRQISVSCPTSAGSYGQCTSLSDGFNVYAVVVPNNFGGAFVDTDGTAYFNCGKLFQNIGNGKVQNVLGVFISNSLVSGDRLGCDNISGCVLNPSTDCFSGWNSVSREPEGTASLPAATNVLVCAYIDNSSLVNPPPPASNSNFTSAMTAITLTNTPTGGIDLNSWTDAF